MRKPRRVDIKVLAATLAAVVILGGAAYLVNRLQVRRNTRALFDQARRAEQKKDRDRAIDYYGRYLILRPDDTETMAKYGLLQADKADEARNPPGKFQAMLTLEQVLRREPDRHPIRRRLIDLAMSVGRFADARVHLETLLKDAFKEDAELERLMAGCFVGSGDEAGAADWLEKAIKHAPTLVENYVALAGLERHRGQGDRANVVMDELVRHNPQSAQARLARWSYRSRFGLPGVEADVRRARELAPDDADVILAVAESAGRRRAWDEARKELRRGLALHPKNARIYQAQAAVEVLAGRTPEAIGRLREGLKALPDAEVLSRGLAELLVESGTLAEAEALVEQLREKKQTPGPVLAYFDATLLIRKGRWAEAAKGLEAARPRLETYPNLTRKADLLLGQVHERLDNDDLRLAAYRRAVAAAPDDVLARLGLAGALLAVGRADEATEEYRRLAPSVPEARLTAARLMVGANLRRPAAGRQWGPIETLLDEAGKLDPGSAAVAVLRAEVLVARDKPDEARTLLRKARDGEPSRPEYWLALAALAERAESPDAALAALDEAQRKLGDRVDIRLARARILANRGGEADLKALAALAEGLDTLPNAKGEHSILPRRLAALAQARDPALARALWSRVARAQPTDPAARYALLDLALRGRDLDAASKALDELTRVEGADGLLGMFGRVRLLIARGQAAASSKKGEERAYFDEARALLAEIAKRRSTWAFVPLAEAEIHDFQGDTTSALPLYILAIDRGERSPAVIRRAAQLLTDRRRFVEADQVIRELVDSGSGPALPDDLRRLAAETALRNQDPDRALDLARRAVPASSKDYRDHLWLGQVLGAVGRAEEAEPALRKAVELAPDQPAPWILLVQLLARAGRRDEAEATIGRAAKALPEGGSRLALAQLQEAAGRRDEAERLYLAELKARPEDTSALRGLANFHLSRNQSEKAEPHLRRIIELRDKAPDDATWARRVLGQILALSDDPGRVREALRVVGLLDDPAPARPAGEAPVEDRRVQALVLSSQPERDRRRQAIALLETMGERQELTPEDRFLLAGLYDAFGEPAKSRQQLLALATEPGAQARHVAALARLLFRQGSPDEARPWIDRIDAMKDRPLPAAERAELQARLLASRGQGAEAAEVLQKVSSGADPAGQRAVASVLEELDLDDEAEALQRRAYEEVGTAAAGLELARFLARRGETDEALRLCEAAWDHAPDEAVARTCVIVAAATANLDEAARRRVERRLREAARGRPESLKLAVDVATFINLTGRPEEAEALYRDVLKRDAGHVAALNNLAWLLALRDAKGAAEALALADRAIRAAGPLPDLLDTRGLAHLGMGQAGRALDDIEAALRVSPTGLLYFHQARAHFKSGNRDAATTSLQRARDNGLDPARLHPLERVTYDWLKTELERKAVADGR